MSALQEATTKAAAEIDKAGGIDVSAIAKGQVELPAFYSGGYKHFMDRAAKLDPEYDHFWVKVSARNEMFKEMKGWVPVEDKAELKRLGLERLTKLAPNGRARYGDTELWRRPKAVGDLVRKRHAELVAEKSSSMAAALAAMADDTAGRTRGQVVPFISTGTHANVMDRVPFSTGKEK